ncbi:DUF2760 domain-containing protein [Desulfosarcina sp. OttesenSCG-928-A07]|nr:DUF2760 domain-containing protein [Desulfosarcina sp. OttesenSCG-928-G17]MDL2330074.1 DUF2760 domain-containing protein [Desulfosarcina sp. OttesenSCG-928-A07]
MQSIPSAFYRRSFVWSLVFSLILASLAACFLWQSELLPQLFEGPMAYAQLYLFVVLFGILGWLVQKNMFSRLWARYADPAQTAPAKEKQKKRTKPESQPQEISDPVHPKNRDQRLFIHLFSELQREGRLMDFLQEDLSLYEDTQIGAAVRSIHENCRKTVDQYITSEPVMSQAEGETVAIEPGFDPQAIRLMGNVVGEPPFTGILRHRGWQIRRFSLPELSSNTTADIIAPAEVEVQ